MLIDTAIFSENTAEQTPQKPQEGLFEKSMIEVEATPEPDIIEIKTDLAPVKAFDVQMLPDSLRDWITDAHERITCPIDYLAVGAMVSLATVIGKKVGIHPKQFDDWLVIPNLWGAIVGAPSAMKSPAMSESTYPLERLAVQARARFKEAQAELETAKIINDTLLEQAKRALSDAQKGKGNLSIEQAAKNYQDIKTSFTSDQVTEKRYTFNDSSVEKLGELLNENPNGLALIRDELTAWLAPLDREDKASERAFYLEAFNGNGTFTYDRIGRGTIFIESVTVSVFGGIQPSKLASHLQGAITGASNDGFVQRLQLAVYPDAVKLPLVDRYPNKEARAKAFELFEALDAMPSQRYTDDWGVERVTGLRFTEAAQMVFYQWYELIQATARDENTPTILESHLIKYASLIPSLALILELADNQQAKAVTEQSLRKAIEWGNYLYSHACRIYENASTEPRKEAARTVIDRREKLPDIFKAKDVHNKNWQGLKDYEQVKKALSLLVEHGYLIELAEQTTGRPSISYRWNKNIKS